MFRPTLVLLLLPLSVSMHDVSTDCGISLVAELVREGRRSV